MHVFYYSAILNEFLGHTHGTRRDVQNPQALAVTRHCAVDMKNRYGV